MEEIIQLLPVKRISAKEKHYFFGYFDKSPWDKSQRYLLAHKAAFMNRQPEAGDKTVIGMFDLEDNDKFIKLAETSAWSWQQGAMLQWLPDYKTKIIFNDREDGKFVARVLDVKTGERQTLCRPVYCVSPNGRYGLSINFARLDRERPGYGYAGVLDEFERVGHPAEDGIWLVDLKNNTSKLIINVDQIVKMSDNERMINVANWFNHFLFAPDSKRFAFFHRWRLDTGGHLTHMYSSDIKGEKIYPLNLQNMSSHYTWFENNKIICFANQDKYGCNYYEFIDQSDKVKAVGEDYFKGKDGHCSYSNDKQWMLTDCYPSPENSNIRNLYLVNLNTATVYVIGKYYADPSLPVPLRCDLHPRWSRDCRSVCFDSIHEGFRAIYTVDLTPIVS